MPPHVGHRIGDTLVTCSCQRCDKLRSPAYPPASASFIAFYATHLLEHANEVRVASRDSAPDKVLSTIHGVIQDVDEIVTSVGSEPVSVGNSPESSRVVADVPSKPLCTELVVDWNTHSGKLGEVVERSTGRSEVEVKETNGDAVSEDNVLQAHVVMANNGSPKRISQLVAPHLQMSGHQS